MLPEVYKNTGKAKFRPRMFGIPGREDDHRKDPYKEAGGKYPVYRIGRKKIVLGETIHSGRYPARSGPYGKGPEEQSPLRDFHKIPGEFMDNTTFITEYPQMAGKKKWKAGKLKIEDRMITEVADYAMNTYNKMNDHVCADGRKAYDHHGKLHEMAVWRTHPDPVKLNHEAIDAQAIEDLAGRYMDRVFFEGSDNVNQFISELNTMVHYPGHTDPGLVIRRTTQRALQLTSRLTIDHRLAIREAVYATLLRELADLREEKQENLVGLQSQEEEKWEMAYEKIAELEPMRALLPPEAYRKLVEKVNRERDEAIEKLRTEVLDRYNRGMIAVLYDVFANVLLLAEVAGAKAERIVVAYGTRHHKPLRRMINKLDYFESIGK